MFELKHGDCLDVLRTMADNSIDAIVTDPPYGLSFMGKRWDYDVPDEDIWRECLRVLKPCWPLQGHGRNIGWRYASRMRALRSGT
jgi:DNA modification methylase